MSTLFRIPVAGVIILACFMVVAPLIALLSMAVAESPVSLFQRAMALPRIGATLFNTVIIAIPIVILAVMVGLILAWCAFAVHGNRRRLVTLIIVTPMLIPGVAAATGWIFIFSRRVGYGNNFLRWITGSDALTGPFDVNTIPWIVGITTIYLSPYPALFALNALRRIDGSLENAARVSGSTWLDTQFRIVLPLLMPAIVYGSAIVLLLALGQFTTVLLLGRNAGIDVLTTQIFTLMEFRQGGVDYGLAAFLSLPLLIAAIMIIISQWLLLGPPNRYISAGKGMASPRRERRWAIWPPVIFGLIATVPPLVGLALVSVTPFWSGKIEVARMNLNAFREVLNNGALVNSIVTSIQYSLIATVMCTLISVVLSVYLVRGRPSLLRSVVEVISNIPLAVPAILFGTGIFFFFAMTLRLYGQGVLLAIAYVVLFLPQGIRFISAGIREVPEALEHAAAISGASRARRYFDILLPLIRNNAASAALIVFVLSTHEFGASILLATPTVQAMAPQLFNIYVTGLYPPVAAFALLIVAVSSIGMLLMLFVGSKSRSDSFF